MPRVGFETYWSQTAAQVFARVVTTSIREGAEMGRAAHAQYLSGLREGHQ